jgi:hypothetical protein
VTIPRFRQSLAKVLIQRSPKDLKRLLDGGEYETTDAMDRGSVLDSMVFGGAVFEQTQYKWKTKVGREQRDALKAQGIIPLRPGQVPESQGLANAVRAKIAELGIDLDDPCTFKQREILWTSDEGVECKGTPDLYTCEIGYARNTNEQCTTSRPRTVRTLTLLSATCTSKGGTCRPLRTEKLSCHRPGMMASLIQYTADTPSSLPRPRARTGSWPSH